MYKRQAVKKVDARARLIATGGDPDQFEQWNAAQLATSPQTFDYLSTHFVVTTSSMLAANPSPDFVAKATFALPVELERQLRRMHQQIQDSPSRNSVNTAFTEWLFFAPDDTYPRYDNMGGALATSGFLNMLLRNADIVPVSDMTGLVEFGGLWKKRSKVYGTPSYWAFKMFSTADVSRSVEVKTDSETYNVEQGSNRDVYKRQTKDHGAPVRLVVPGWYGCTCIKWVNEIALVGEDAPATSQMQEFATRTMQQGVPELAKDYQPAIIEQAAMPIRVEKWRIDRKIKYRVNGIAWGGSRPVSDLEIRFHSGEDFVLVDDFKQTANDPWSFWTHAWTPVKPGIYAIQLRVKDISVPSRRLNSGYYVRSVEVTEI